MTFYLASRSPRRAELLSQIGVIFNVLTVDVDETRVTDEPATDYVARLANIKAQEGLNALGQSSQDGTAVILGADTIVYIDQQVLGKPRDRQQAAEYLALLSGQTHRVATAVTLAQRLNGIQKMESALSISQVRFKTLTQAEMAAYCATEEPYDKAGGYAVQGIAAMFIQSISGSYSGIMGLPLFETANLLARFKVPTILTPER